MIPVKFSFPTSPVIPASNSNPPDNPHPMGILGEYKKTPLSGWRGVITSVKRYYPKGNRMLRLWKGIFICDSIDQAPQK
jgi:hypothetical protein